MAKCTSATSEPASNNETFDVDYDAGHGIGSQREQTRKLWADQMAFALWQFGDPDFLPK